MIKKLKYISYLIVLHISIICVLAGCSYKKVDFGMPHGITDRSNHVMFIWQITMWCSIVIGAIVLGLIIYSILRFRAKNKNIIPKQTQYNNKLEVIYTIVPVIIVVVLFIYTFIAQHAINKINNSSTNNIHVVARQWSWTFNYIDNNPKVYDIGTQEDKPTLYLVKDQKTTFIMTSPDVIHSFWIPAFLYKMDVIPGRENKFQITADKYGTYPGRCAEFCGLYHSKMLFTLKVVNQKQYNQHMKYLKSINHIGEIQ